MPRPRKNVSTSEQSQSPPSSGMVMAPLKGYGEVMGDKYQWFLPTVEHCMEQIANDWCSRINDPKSYDQMVERLCHQVGTHRLLSTFISSDHSIIKGWARQIETEVLSGSVPVKNDGNF